MARALGIALAGPRSYDGTLRAFPWVNAPGDRHPGPDDIAACVRHLWRAWALFAAFVAALALLT